MNAQTFFRELKRRNVYKVALAYAVIAWLLIETAALLFSGHEERRFALAFLIGLFAAGFLLALYISWAFEATPQGMKRTENVTPDVAAALPYWSSRKFALFIISIALLAAGMLVFDLSRNPGKPCPRQQPPRPEASRSDCLADPAMKTPRDIDEYITGFAPAVRKILQAIRNTIRKAAPGAEEKISYGIPCYVFSGHNLVHFAAFKNHIGLYPRTTAIAKFKKDLARYEISKGTIRFPLGKSVPLGLITKIVKFRMKETASSPVRH